MSCIPLPCARSLTIGRNQQHTLGSSVRTHQTFSPVVVSNICAVRLQPVARYRPSGEKWTEQTALFKKTQKQQGCLCNYYSPLMDKRMNKVNVKRFLTSGLYNTTQSHPFSVDSTGRGCIMKSSTTGTKLIEGKPGVYVHHHEEKKTLTRLIILLLEPLRITSILCAVHLSSPLRPLSTSCLQINISQRFLRAISISRD